MQPLNRRQIAWRRPSSAMGVCQPVITCQARCHSRPEYVFIHSENGVIGAGTPMQRQRIRRR
jgi:hypothetical protein